MIRTCSIGIRICQSLWIKYICELKSRAELEIWRSWRVNEKGDSQNSRIGPCTSDSEYIHQDLKLSLDHSNCDVLPLSQLKSSDWKCASTTIKASLWKFGSKKNISTENTWEYSQELINLYIYTHLINNMGYDSNKISKPISGRSTLAPWIRTRSSTDMPGRHQPTWCQT